MKILSGIILSWIMAASPVVAGLPWHNRDKQTVEIRSAEFLLDEKWNPAHSTVKASSALTPTGGRTIEFGVDIPPGKADIWPAIEVKDGNFDFSGYDTLRFYIKCESAVRPIKLIFFLTDTSEQKTRRYAHSLTLAAGQWKQVDYPLNNVAPARQISRVHFFLCGSDYLSGGNFRFQIGGFELLKTKSVSRSSVSPAGIACMMKVGRPGHGLQLVKEKSSSLPAELTFETGTAAKIEALDVLRFRFRELFTGRLFEKNVSPKFKAGSGAVSRYKIAIPAADLPAGYYVVTADLLRDNRSLLNGLVGSDQFYIQKNGESPAYTALSVRTGMIYMIEDLIHGGTFSYTAPELPHIYDPFNPETYRQFRELYAWSTNKDAEHYEAALGGLYFAHLAFQKLNDEIRTEAVEKLIRNYAFYMMSAMQRPDGSIMHIVNEYTAIPGDLDGCTTIYDNQVGEWITSMCYAIMALQHKPENAAFVHTMKQACRRAVEYICRNTRGNGAERVFVNAAVWQPLREPGREVYRQRYRQAGVDCDVYNPRTLTGVAFYAYLAELAGEEIPEEWWIIMHNTAKWSDKKMKPNGHYDWQCGEWEENGCHTYLGNIYLGEAMLHYYLAAREAGRTDDAALAAQVCTRAFRYITDACTVMGKRFEPPTEFWVGPYNYWLFELYRQVITDDNTFADWQNVQKKFWVRRQWRDFFRDESAGPLCGRAKDSSSLTISSLAFPALYLLDTNKLTWKWPRAAK